MSKARLKYVEMQARLRAVSNRPSKTLERFRSAWERGKVFCRDGKERTVEEWLAYLSADLGEKMREALAGDEKK